MKRALALARRNVLCYFRNRSSVVFSLMAVIIVMILYLLFPTTCSLSPARTWTACHS